MGREVKVDMNCQVCGGTLKYVDGLYICESCGAKQQVGDFFEKTEVFICYIESDEQGRRTKDSVIAQDLYNKLEAIKINTFYQRVSVAELTGDDCKKTCAEALDKSKVIIIAGVSKVNFEALLERYKNDFEGKRIFPVYSGINAYDLPKEFGSLQALNYDNIGSINDLAKAVLNALGRENEIDVITDAELKKYRKKKFLLSVGIAVALILIFGAYIVFGTHYVLDSKKYAYAEKLTEKGNYVEAIDIYAELGEYHNSAGALKSIYDKYDGYFITEDESLCLNINIEDTSATNIEIIKVIDDKTIRARANTTISKNIIEFSFLDSQGVNGTGKVLLINNEVQLITNIDNSESLSIGNNNVAFDINNKSGAPIGTRLTKDELLSWLKNKTTEQDIYQKGYELETVSDESGVNNAGIEVCKIKNTNIEVLLFPYDVEKVGYDIHSYEDGATDNSKTDNKIVAGITAPVDIIVPNINDYPADEYIEDDLFYKKNHRVSATQGTSIG